jgi:hypothetical protein
MQVATLHTQTDRLVSEVFRKLPPRQRKLVETEIAAIANRTLVTAVRPFMFSGRIVHELYFDVSKLLLLTEMEKIGAIASAFIISFIAQEGKVPLSDQTLRTHTGLIVRYAKRMKYGTEVLLFLRRFMILEDEWRRNSFPDLPEYDDKSSSVQQDTPP